MSTENKSIINRIREKLFARKHEQTPTQYKESFFKNAKITETTDGYNSSQIENFALPKAAQSIEEFNNMLTSFLSEDVQISTTQFGQYFPQLTNITNNFFRAEISNGEDKLLVINRYDSPKLSVVRPEEDLEFSAYTSGKRFCPSRHSQFLSSHRTGGYWNEEISKSISPVFELSDQGKITQVGGEITTKTLWHNGSTGASREDSREFVDMETYDKLTKNQNIINSKQEISR